MTANYLRNVLTHSYSKDWEWPECREKSEEWEKVIYKGPSGNRLAGIYSSTTNNSKGVIVCGHPMHVLAKGYFLKNGHATFLKNAGYDVFLFDFNGFGESECCTLDYPGDVLASANIARSLAGNSNVGYLGVSFGAAWAISAMKHSHDIRFAFLESPFASFLQFYQSFVDAGLSLRIMKYIRPSLFRNLHPILNACEVQGVKKLKFVFGESDRIVPPETGQRFLSYLNIEENYRSKQVKWFTIPTINAEMKILPTRLHAKGYEHPEYFHLVEDFFEN